MKMLELYNIYIIKLKKNILMTDKILKRRTVCIFVSDNEVCKLKRREEGPVFLNYLRA